MDGMTKEEIEEYQEHLSRLRASAPETFAYPTRQRIRLIANPIVDRMIEDQKNGAPLLHKIQFKNKEPKRPTKEV